MRIKREDPKPRVTPIERIEVPYGGAGFRVNLERSPRHMRLTITGASSVDPCAPLNQRELADLERACRIAREELRTRPWA